MLLRCDRHAVLVSGGSLHLLEEVMSDYSLAKTDRLIVVLAVNEDILDGLLYRLLELRLVN